MRDEKPRLVAVPDGPYGLIPAVGAMWRATGNPGDYRQSLPWMDRMKEGDFLWAKVTQALNWFGDGVPSAPRRFL